MVIVGNNTQLLLTKTFAPLPSFDIDFEIHAKVFNQEGDLKYEYNAFRNLRDPVTGELKDLRSDQFNLEINRH